ncbi:MAG: serine acetyltransferase [Desulfobulbaceae bacterium]|jgi:serine O-acetyltransferase|nr:serine acetyltransferase [Desulfobulbaceae bacterium]
MNHEAHPSFPAVSELDHVVEQLCSPSSLKDVIHRPLHDAPMPCLATLQEILASLKIVLFPGYFGMSAVRVESMRYHLAAHLDSVVHKLAEQIRCGACFACVEYAYECLECERVSREKTMEFIKRLPRIRYMLATDADAAYRGDPAAASKGETIFCYPSILAMIHYRIAHELHSLHVPVIPRILCEMAHAITGIDIHPGAVIDESFFIDHGTGVVIGETCVIGRRCRLYQGVTLGALSFPKDTDGICIKGITRHPRLEDDVTVYAGATILGNITVGERATIGANTWVTRDVPRNGKLVNFKPGVDS